MRTKTSRWIYFGLLISTLQLGFCEDIIYNSTQIKGNGHNRGIFSPRMDYDQWKPLGRGDPLKNDPTYDYVPPVLDRVHYWVDPALRKPDPPLPGENKKTEILLLGVSSKKPSTGTSVADSRRDTFDPFMKFVEGPKFNNNQRVSHPHFSSYFPTAFFTNKNKYSERTPFSKGGEQRVPYTMLIPPPIDTRKPNIPRTSSSFAKPTPVIVNTAKSAPLYTTPPAIFSSATPQVTIQAANLVYHSSSLSDESEWKNKNHYATVASSISWKESTTQPTISTINKNKPDYKEKLVYSTNLQPPESYIHIEFAPHNDTINSLIGADSNHNTNYVTPPPLVKTGEKEFMFKGEVSDDNIDISNTYVKIMKSEAQVHSAGLDIPNLPPQSIQRHPLPLIRPQNMMMAALQHMQTMQPPPITQITSSPVYKTTHHIVDVLKKEIQLTSSAPYTTTTFTPETETTVTVTELTTAPPTTTTTSIASPTSTTTSLTTDPLFKHYKQPVEPLKGPLYLIIQGHSKVKTYGPSKQLHGISVQETNEISDEKYEYNVKHLHGHNRKDTSNRDENLRKSRSGNLQTLKHVVQTGLGAIDVSDLDANRRNYQVAELKIGYAVASGKDMTSEKYHKGIVEEARKLKI